MMNEAEKWGRKHRKVLKSLYRDFQNDTGDKSVGFIEFCVFMFFQCQH